MINKLIVITLIVVSSLLQGCLTFNTMSYEIVRNDEGGIVTVEINDIRTDAADNEKLEEDKNFLFDYALNSREFVSDQAAAGKKILSRELFKSDDILNGKITYSFTDISSVEGIQYEKPYYYLTVSPEDSIVSSNGQIIKNKDYNRIIWDENLNSFKFKMFSENTGTYRSMAEFYNQ